MNKSFLFTWIVYLGFFFIIHQREKCLNNKRVFNMKFWTSLFLRNENKTICIENIGFYGKNYPLSFLQIDVSIAFNIKLWLLYLNLWKIIFWGIYQSFFFTSINSFVFYGGNTLNMFIMTPIFCSTIMSLQNAVGLSLLSWKLCEQMHF